MCGWSERHDGVASVTAPARRTGDVSSTTMSPFRDVHAGACVIVCGCGESLNLLGESAAEVTIGVNDVGRKLTPTYLVVVNPRSQFAPDRLAFIEDSTAQAVFSQLRDLRLRYAPL